MQKAKSQIHSTSSWVKQSVGIIKCKVDAGSFMGFCLGVWYVLSKSFGSAVDR